MPVGASLLYVLEMHIGKDWNDSVKNAWVGAYGVITKCM